MLCNSVYGIFYFGWNQHNKQKTIIPTIKIKNNILTKLINSDSWDLYDKCLISFIFYILNIFDTRFANVIIKVKIKLLIINKLPKENFHKFKNVLKYT